MIMFGAICCVIQAFLSSYACLFISFIYLVSIKVVRFRDNV